jgi:MinD-like ATPase involved in chromosome partitioning or flagellar assembly
MIPAAHRDEPGTIYTFYSFKGGVGRTMALANVAALLAKWGHSVLAVDFDLEAPGLERFFCELRTDIQKLRAETPGIVDLVESGKLGQAIDWRECLLDVTVPGDGGKLSVLSAGRNTEDYPARLQSLDFTQLFREHDLGSYIEHLRDEWKSEFEFVLIDSRTGVTDIGGICTVHLADMLVLLFTTNRSSTEGALDIVERARKAQSRLPLDRRRLLALPVPARDESRTEYRSAMKWRNRFAEQFGELYRDWLPSGKTAHDAIDLLRIPYVPYWSFGEQLPVIEEGTADPSGIGHAYEIIARLLATRLDWFEALKGQTLAPPPAPARRELDPAWLSRHRKAAEVGLRDSGLRGFMEICHFSPDATISKTQPELLTAARQAQVPTLGWPIGVVLNGDARPKPIDEGIVAEVPIKRYNHPMRGLDYWTLSRAGDFYTLKSLAEDRIERQAGPFIYFDVRIMWAAEALLHCEKLYKALGVEPGAHVELAIRYGGLRGRTLEGSPGTHFFEAPMNTAEDEVGIAPVSFALDSIQSELVELVKRLCEPLFVVFDYTSFTDELYESIVTGFAAGKVT